MSFVAVGPAPQQTAGDCKKVMCDGAGAVSSQNDDTDPTVDGNQCTDDLCSNGTPSNPTKALNTACTQSGGKVCSASGACVECNDGSHCTSLVCNTTNHTCSAATCSDSVQNGGETGVDCGGPCPLCPTVLAIVGNASAVAGAELTVGGSWVTTSLGGKSTDGLSLVTAGAALAVAGVRFTASGDANDQAVQWATWTPGIWTQLANVGTGVTTRTRPGLVGGAAGAQLVFQGTDFKYYFAAFTGTWSTPEAVGPSGSQQFGANGADIALVGANPVVVYANGASSNDLYSDERVSAVWQSPASISGSVDFSVIPAVVALSTGPELLAVWAQSSSGQLRFATRTGGTWSAPADITGATTAARPSVAALPGGGAALAFKGTDGKLYVSQYASSTWSSPAGLSSPNVNSTSSPAVAKGVGTASVEIAFIEADGVAYHSRLISSSWTTPVPIGGTSLNNVAITSLP